MEDAETIKERLKRIKSEYYNGNTREFEIKCEIKEGTLKHVFSGRSLPSYEIVEKILRTNVQIDARWLITGKGNMLNIQESFLQRESDPNITMLIESNLELTKNNSELIKINKAAAFQLEESHKRVRELEEKLEKQVSPIGMRKTG